MTGRRGTRPLPWRAPGRSADFFLGTVQAFGVLERSPVECPLEMPGDACRAFLLLRVELKGQVDGFLLCFRPGESHDALKRVFIDVDLRQIGKAGPCVPRVPASPRRTEGPG